MTTIYFVRHAEPNYTDPNDYTRALTPKGKADCARVVSFFEKIPVDAVYSSPYRRAVDTVKEMAKQKRLPITLIEDFRERRAAGEWITDFSDFADYAKRQWENFSYHLPGGECLQEVQERNVNALLPLLSKHHGETIVIGGHGTAICTVLRHYDPAFGFEAFDAMRHKMPWVVRLQFEEDLSPAVQSFDLFEEEQPL